MAPQHHVKKLAWLDMSVISVLGRQRRESLELTVRGPVSESKVESNTLLTSALGVYTRTHARTHAHIHTACMVYVHTLTPSTAGKIHGKV